MTTTEPNTNASTYFNELKKLLDSGYPDANKSCYFLDDTYMHNTNCPKCLNTTKAFAVWLGPQDPKQTDVTFSTAYVTDSFMCIPQTDVDNSIILTAPPMRVNDEQYAHTEIRVHEDGKMQHDLVTRTYTNGQPDSDHLVNETVAHPNHDGNYHFAKELIESSSLCCAEFASDTSGYPNEALCVMLSSNY